MKNSGVPWLGEVPEHWEVRKLKYAVSFSGGGTPSKADASFWGGAIPWVSPKDMTRARITDSMDHITEEAVTARAASIVSPGALLMVVRSGILRRTIPVAINAAEVALNQDLKALRPRTGVVASEYLRALVQGNEVALIQEWTKQGATVESIEHELLANSPVPLPPLSEQATIVRFLDHADRRIRRYIRAKQKLIKLLEELKAAIIHRAVTGQIDVRTGKPYPRYKPSGVEWLGHVPEHWEVARLGRLIELVTGFPFKSDGFTQDAEDIRLLRGVNISPGKIRWADVVRWPLSERDKYSPFELQVGDIVLGMDRPLIQSGTRVAIVTEPDVPALVLQRVARIRPRAELQSEFLALLLAGKSFADYLTPIFTGISVPHLSPEQIKSFCFALPTDNEQREIVRWTAERTRKTDVTISNADREIQLLREFRTRLIADVVTGKLDVREAAARLPQEAEDLEPLDETEALGEMEGESAADDLEPESQEAEA